MAMYQDPLVNALECFHGVRAPRNPEEQFHYSLGQEARRLAREAEELRRQADRERAERRAREALAFKPLLRPPIAISEPPAAPEPRRESPEWIKTLDSLAKLCLWGYALMFLLYLLSKQ